jgi:hypothetical protein
MIFYQAYGKDFECELRTDPKDSFQDLKNRFYEVLALRGIGDSNDYPLFDPNRNIGIAIIHT